MGLSGGAAPVDVPGKAGKSSEDIVNSDCSDVGCLTIPTVKRIIESVKFNTSMK